MSPEAQKARNRLVAEALERFQAPIESAKNVLCNAKTYIKAAAEKIAVLEALDLPVADHRANLEVLQSVIATAAHVATRISQDLSAEIEHANFGVEPAEDTPF